MGSVKDMLKSRPKDPGVRNTIVTRVWGQDLRPIYLGRSQEEWINKHREILKSYFNYYYDQVSEQNPDEIPGTLKIHEELLMFIDLLKQNADIPRTQLKEACQTVYEGRTYDGPVRFPTDLRRFLKKCGRRSRDISIHSALAIAVRVVFAINVHVSPEPRADIMVIGQTNLFWTASTCLSQFLVDSFPKSDHDPGSGILQIKPNKFRVRYLENHAGIKVRWTTQLADHLKLNTAKDEKTLKVFELVSLLKVSYDAMSSQDFHALTSTCVRFGCYSPDFLWETLKTIQLLFPPRDWDWLKEKIKEENRRSERRLLDMELLCHFDDWHKRDPYLRALTSTDVLFRTYPYWAVRLEMIYQEAEDPTPISCFGRWAERRKAPRHSYLVAFWGVLIAIFFGIAALILSAVQTWVSYQAWKHPPSPSGT